MSVPKSQALQDMFGWNDVILPSILAYQLNALSKVFSESKDPQGISLPAGSHPNCSEHRPLPIFLILAVLTRVRETCVFLFLVLK